MFILRAFKFTSQTAHCFLKAMASNHESNVLGLSGLLRGSSVSHGNAPLLDDVNVCLLDLRSKYEDVFEALGIRERCAPAELDSDSLRETVLYMSRSKIIGERRAILIVLLEKIGRVPQIDNRLLKRHLIEALIKAQDDLRTGALQLPDQLGDNTTEESLVE